MIQQAGMAAQGGVSGMLWGILPQNAGEFAGEEAAWVRAGEHSG